MDKKDISKPSLGLPRRDCSERAGTPGLSPPLFFFSLTNGRAFMRGPPWGQVIELTARAAGTAKQSRLDFYGGGLACVVSQT